jgi:hypothetical protein
VQIVSRFLPLALVVEQIRPLDWKLQDVVVTVVRELDGAPEDVLVRGTVRARTLRRGGVFLRRLEGRGRPCESW